ncbi:MAG: type II secretion system GspH family protein [Oscillospiraceae bacterium]|jgi:type IV pilus assembly protein PilA|nr:type II secretion system GspH family protein [Oscillospiraceae bacterium]
MKNMQTLRRNKRKGFTLVEIIVVLVIMAVLIAALAPVMIGWIAEARDSSMMATGRAGYSAVQSFIADLNGRGVGFTAAQSTWVNGDYIAEQPNTTSPYTLSGGSTKFVDLLNDLDPTDFFNITWNANGQLLSIGYRIGGSSGTGRYAMWYSSAFSGTRVPAGADNGWKVYS